MKYGQIAGSKSINEFISHCFKFISEEDQKKFIKKFKTQPHDSIQIMHTFRELILGAHLNATGFNAVYEYNLENNTPDWCILNEKSRVQSIIELTNFNIDYETDKYIQNAKESKNVVCYWRDANKDNIKRLFETIKNKVLSYRLLTENLKLPFVVALFSTFEVAIDLEEIKKCLYNMETGLFNLYPELSGLLFLEEKNGSYSFFYESSPVSFYKIYLTGGLFSLETG